MFNIIKVRKKLEEKTQLSKEEEEVLRQAAELAKRRKKLHWLKTEQQMVDLHLAIRFWSSHKFLEKKNMFCPVKVYYHLSFRTSLSSSNPLIPRCISHLTALIALPMQVTQTQNCNKCRLLRYKITGWSVHQILAKLRISEFTQNFWVFSVYIADLWQTFWVILVNG